MEFRSGCLANVLGFLRLGQSPLELLDNNDLFHLATSNFVNV